MVQVTRKFTVARPVAEVIDYLKDFSRTEAWDPGTVSCRRADSGPVRVGARWHNVSKLLGRETELDYELVTMEPSRLTFVGRNKTATSTDDISVTPVAGGSEIVYQATIEFNGIAKVASPVLKVVFERLGDETVQSLSRLLK